MLDCAVILTDKHEIKFYEIFQNPDTFEIKEPHIFVGFIILGRPINIDLHSNYFRELRSLKTFILKPIELFLMSKQTFNIFIPTNLYREANTKYSLYIDAGNLNVFQN
jgi:hypothetical protein